MKQLLIIVKPNAPKTKILSESATEIKLAVAAPPEHNKANIEVIKFLSKYFGADVRIVSGLKAKRKIVRIE